jgi:selenocysteine lyase/cysteine desulfurase
MLPALCCREATRGGYETLDASSEALRRPYTALAQLLNCQADEIAILSSATAAWQQVVYGLAWAWQPGERVRALGPQRRQR